MPSRPPTKRSRHNHADFEISSVSSQSSSSSSSSASSRSLPEETPDQMRIRLAKQLLEQIQPATNGTTPPSSPHSLDATTIQLHHQLLSSQQLVRTSHAPRLVHSLSQNHHPVERTRGQGRHRLSTTSICLTSDSSCAYSGSKDGSLRAWDTASGLSTWTARTADPCLAVAVSSDGRHLASAGRDSIHVWDVRESPVAPVRILQGHRDEVTSLAFRLNTHILLSGSMDRSVRVWNAAEGSFIENLFGHQAGVTAIDCLAKERAVTASVDVTVRLWKIPEESHLVLSGKHVAAIDSVRMLDETLFVSGSQDGSLALWHTSKKRPTCVLVDAHGPGRWINSVAALPFSDLVASGSDDGLVRVWAVDVPGQIIHPDPVAALECEGNVNGLALGREGLLACATGKEHRLGRWRPQPQAKNSVCFFRLPCMAD